MSKELMPCPFCGGNARMSVSRAPICYVVCSLCNTCGPVDNREDGAITAWNRRATHPQPVTPAGGEVEPFGWWMQCHGTDSDFGQFVTDRAFLENMRSHGVVQAVTALYDHPPVADAALVRDAERYRWIRDPPLMAKLPAWIAGQGNEFIESDWLTGEQADAAIDAALNQRGGGE